MKYIRTLTVCLLLACGDDSSSLDAGDSPDAVPPDTTSVDVGSADVGSAGCGAEAEVQTTAGGVEFVRTPDDCFTDLPRWPFAPRYVELDGLRQAYVDEGPASGPVVLLLHGQPSWSYLYRDMIPVLTEGGFRVIAMDHLGMGRSDKPTSIEAYSYLGHADRLARFIDALDLQEIRLFVQDWGALLGLRVAGLDPERFAAIAVGNGALPVIPAGVQPFPAVENPEETVDLASPFASLPAQQRPFYDGCEPLSPGGTDFSAWMNYAMKARDFRPSEVLEALTWFDVPANEEAAYDAPFPSRVYMAGVRSFPSLVNELPGLNADAWAGLMSFERPFITIWAANDPGGQGSCDAQQHFVDGVPGAAGLPHTRLEEASHFLQDDQGEEIARRLVRVFSGRRLRPVVRGTRYCEILLVRPAEGGLAAEVWGTQGLNECPAESWESLDAEMIQADAGASAVIFNGPRNWIPNATTGSRPTLEFRSFGDIEMILLASLLIDPEAGNEAYEERIVRRTTTYIFDAGEEVYELRSPSGEVYVMQSVSQILDETLSFADLPGLGERLSLPDGWSYAARTLESDLVLNAEGEARVLQDDLNNTYQRQ